jgi:hypothetical protein
MQRLLINHNNMNTYLEIPKEVKFLEFGIEETIKFKTALTFYPLNCFFKF